MATGALAAGEDVRAALRDAGDRILVHDPEHGLTRTGTDLLQNVQALAGALAGRGLRGGARIGLWFSNSAASIEAFLAVELLGATRIPVEAAAAAGEAAAIFEAGRADAVLADADHARHLPGALVHDHDQPLHDTPFLEVVEVPEDQPLIIYPRAVTAGELFGVPTSYRNWRAIMQVNQDLYRRGGYGPGFDPATACFLTVQQLMHGTGMIGSFPFLLMSLPQVVLSRFDPGSTLEAIERHGVTATFAVPGMLTRLADRLEADGAPAPPSLRHTLYGGAPITVEDLERVRRCVGPSVCQLYGRFEAGWPLTVLTQEDHGRLFAGEPDVVGSCGRAVERIELTVRPVPGAAGSARDGELATRSAMVSPAYADADGWLSLGDTARITDRGYVHLTGRLDGMINTGSYHVYPEEVREALTSQPEVRDALVRGEPDPVWGQAVTAYVVPEAASPDLAEDLRRRTRNSLAPYKVPKSIRLVDTLPVAPA
ncbi:acyl-CoA synthetase (AMP-forming)/AMP-acid ligase II [Actinomycetospora succinea]|uniref:Acyl-CoA synthetase (AMP-forming)/AMP-acid ligase II n=1 Tax=Actinomycetospora succinea TaxID=663603 RepID=A0A4R6VNE9_9PSEU|nr:class I adenylate-forming enzyme family protein [Actinomycetospora succinea]TDQ64811.1 acyl-CoA synthetase (AMP-forming)/AMP-acid ligase II [Actinomycetospora succinea]